MSKHFAPCGFYNKETGEIKIALFNSDCHDENWVDAYFLCDCKNFQEGCIAIPSARKPMTEEEILEAARDHYNPNQRAEISFARAIEKHHGIGKDDE